MSYSIITPWEEMEYPNNVGVIFTDSNFMINLGKEFFAKPGIQNRNKRRDDLLDLFKRIREYNIQLNPSLSITESCISRTGEFDLNRYNKFNYIFDSVSNTGYSKIIRQLEGNRPLIEYTNSVKNLRGMNMYNLSSNDFKFPQYPFDILKSSIIVRNHYMPGLYGSILKLVDIYRQGGDPEVMYEEFIDWSMDDLGRLSAYVTWMAATLLFGDNASSGKVKKIIKYRGNNVSSPKDLAQDCWNGAWDSYFMNILEGGFSFLPVKKYLKNKNLALITENKDPVVFRRGIKNKYLFIDNNNVSNFMAANLRLSNKYKNKDLQCFEYRTREFFERSKRDQGYLDKKAILTVDKLEDELGIKEKTIWDISI